MEVRVEIRGESWGGRGSAVSTVVRLLGWGPSMFDMVRVKRDTKRTAAGAVVARNTVGRLA